MTLTRCSSTPSGETLVNPEGSILWTCPASGGRPLPSSRSMGAPGRTRTASLDRTSTTTSIEAGSPSSISGVPAGTTRSDFSNTRSTLPATGARTSTTCPGPIVSMSAARALLTSAAAPCARNRAAASSSEALRSPGSLPEQHRGHLAAREAEHAQARQLPPALGEGDAGTVVDDAEGDATSKAEQKRDEREVALGHGAVERGDHGCVDAPRRPPRASA